MNRRSMITMRAVTNRIVVIPLVALILSVQGLAAEPQKSQRPHKIDSKSEQFFENRVRPLLVNRCWKCHGEKQNKGGLRLNSRAAAIRGGDSGAAVKPNKPGASLLMDAVRYEGFDMPPDGRLSDEEVKVLQRWIEIGAPWPRETSKTPADSKPNERGDGRTAIHKAARTHWALQPVADVEPPTEVDKLWCANEVDHFVSSRLRQSNLTPSTEADRRTLLRRTYFDLLGMPPTVEETRRFLADNTSQAFSRLVDRLLDDPRYGERWGRHWLDVARYADTKGAIFGEPREYPYAYTYRDYVVAAFNDDKPYDQFVREQLAADLMTKSRTDPSLAALGFLTVHRRSNNGGEVEQWADRVDTVSRGFLGLTVACARCHDHKYDPIPTADYYSLFGVFASIKEPKELPIIGRPEPGSKLARSYNTFLAEEDRKRDEFISSRLQKLLKKFRGQVGGFLLLVHEGANLNEADFRVLASRKKLNANVALRWRTYLDKRLDRAVFGAWKAFAALPAAKFAEQAETLTKRIIANELPGQQLNPLVVDAFRESVPKTLSDVSVRYQRLFDRVDKKTVATAGSNLSAAENVIYELLYGEGSPGVVPAGNFSDLDRPAYLQLLRVEAERKLRLGVHPGSPRRAMIVHDTGKPYDPYVFIRGNKSRRGSSVPRQFLAMLSNENRRPFQHGSGRKELADAIVAPDNPLTARVMVNRIWLHHFGRGLVATPDDFGLRAQLPTHPKLLDWLAQSFMNNGWSVKHLHRLIMNSATYRQSSNGDAQKFAIDPENRLLWRYNRRRLDYEAIHDSLLAVSGKLDAMRGGPAVTMFRGAEIEKNAVGKNNRPFNPNRRAIYAVIRRDELPAVMKTFDFASPDETTSLRHITTVPTQGLYLLNNEFVMNLSTALVSSVASGETGKGKIDSSGRIHQLFQRCFQRPPTERELAACLSFVSEVDSPETPLQTKPKVWTFGHASYDIKTGKHDLSVVGQFPHRSEKAMQGDADYPDKKNGYGWTRLTAGGGHAAGSIRCVVRRWTSPTDGVVSLSGILGHKAKEGDGVRATVYGPQGRLAQWKVHNSSISTVLERVEVSRGDVIDFVVDQIENGSYDGFLWAPTVRESIASTGGTSIDGGASNRLSRLWSSKQAFMGLKPLSGGTKAKFGPWERLAQTLLISNEFVYVE